MFRGTQDAKIDEKGRLKVPADFMKPLADNSWGPVFFITSRDGKTAELWPMQNWEPEEAKKAVLPEDDPAKITWMRIVNYFGAVVEIDKQDRLMLPRKVRERFGLVNVEVVVTGQGKFLSVQRESDADQEITNLLNPGSVTAMSAAEARQSLASREAAAQQRS
jgi:MraZ protein